MMKTKLGISVGMMGALMFFVCMLGGYPAAILLAGYILIAEENIWLKKTAVKAVVLMIVLSLINVVLGLIPDVIEVVHDFQRLADEYPETANINNLIYALQGIVALAEKVLFTVLGVFAFSQATIKIPVVDSLISKYVD